MRIERLLGPFLLFHLIACAGEPSAEPGMTEHRINEPPGADHQVPIPAPDILDFDIFQGTCALYVAIRSSALGGPIAFGREIDDSMVHWNFCPGGNMVACAVAPTANGDPVLTGIPWPY